MKKFSSLATTGVCTTPVPTSEPSLSMDMVPAGCICGTDGGSGCEKDKSPVHGGVMSPGRFKGTGGDSDMQSRFGDEVTAWSDDEVDGTDVGGGYREWMEWMYEESYAEEVDEEWMGMVGEEVGRRGWRWRCGSKRSNGDKGGGEIVCVGERCVSCGGGGGKGRVISSGKKHFVEPQHIPLGSHSSNMPPREKPMRFCATRAALHVFQCHDMCRLICSFL